MMKNIYAIWVAVAVVLVAVLPVSVSAKKEVANKDSETYYIKRAIEEAQENNIDEAISFLEMELLENPKNGYAHMLIVAYSMKQGWAFIARDAVEKALKYLPKKEEKYRSDMHIFRSELKAIDRDTVGAYADLEEAIRLCPTNPEIYNSRAGLYSQQGRYDESEADLRKVLELEPDNTAALIGFGVNAAARGDYDKAIEYLNRSAEMNPDDLRLTMLRADIMGESGNVEEAIRLWSEFIEQNPDHPNGYYRRGFFEDNAGRTQEALNDYEKTIFLAPDYAYAYLGKGDMLKKLGRTEEAIEAYQMAVELDTVPEEGSCAMFALIELGRGDEAIDFTRRLIESDPSSSSNYYEAACVYSRLGQPEKALEYFKTALKKGYVHFHHAREDEDLEEMRKLPEFEDLMKEYEVVDSVESPK